MSDPRPQQLVYTSYGTPEVLSLQDFQPISLHGPQIAVKAVSVNPVDWKIMAGEQRLFSGNPRKHPHIFGSDFSGIRMGFPGPAQGVGICGMVNPLVRGSAASRIAVRGAVHVALDPSLSLRDAAALPAAGISAYRMIMARPGSWWLDRPVFLFGASGGVGHLFLQKAASLGARVLALSRRENHPVLSSLGAWDCLEYRGLEPDDLLAHPLAHGPKPPLLCDCHSRTIGRVFAPRGGLGPMGKEMAKNHWTYFPLSIPNPLIGRVIAGKLRHPRTLPTGITLAVPSLGLISQVVADWQAGIIRPLIAACFPLSAWRQALEMAMDSHPCGKILIEFPGE